MRSHYERDRFDRERRDAGRYAPPGRPDTSRNTRTHESDQLTTSDMRVLQKALIALGYDVGSPDGRPGRRTGQAVASLLRSKGLDPYNTSPRDALALAQNEAARFGSSPAVVKAASTSVVTPPSDGEDILLLDEVSSQYRNYYDNPDVADARRKQNEKLALLFILKSNPALIDEKEKSILFAPIVAPALTQSLIRHSMRKEPGWDWGSRNYLNWMGEDQFEQEDSRQAFLKAHKDLILQEIKHLPDRAKIIWAVSFKEYNDTTETLKVEFHSRSAYAEPNVGSNIGFDIALSFALPTEWKLTPPEARQLLARSRPKPGSSSSVYAAGSFKIKALRPWSTGVTMDLELLDDLKLYDSVKLERQVGTFPRPDGKVAQGGSPDSSRKVYLDAMFPRLWAVSKNDAVANKEWFVRESFRLRRIMEKQARDTKGERPTNWPLAISNALLSSNLEPSAEDLRSFATWLRDSSKSVSDAATISVRILRGDADRTRSQDLHASVEFNGDYAGRERDWIKPAMLVARQAFPDSIDIKLLWSGDDAPTLVALSPHPAWYALEMKVPDTGYPADLDVAIKDAKRIPIEGGGPGILVFNVEPTALRFRKESGVADITFEAAREKTLEASKVGKFDVAGVRIGMPLEDALAAMRAFETDPLVEKSLTLKDPIFANSKTFERRKINESPEEVVRIFFDDAQPDRPVIAIGRLLALKDFETTDQAAAGLRPRLEVRYGPATRLYDGDLYWSSDPVTDKKIKSRFDYENPCHHFGYRNFYDTNSSGSWSQGVETACGEVLSAKIHQQSLTQFLTNTNVFARMRQAQEAVTRPKPDPSHNIKF